MRLLVGIFVIGIICYSVFSSGVRGQKAQESGLVPEASRLWELAITAKGGRQKLHQVNSLAVFYEYSRGRESNELYVFPNKRWDWFDTGPSSKYPLKASVKDFEQRIACVNQRNITEGCESIGNYSKRSYLDGPQLLYLLETKWVKPEFLTTSKDALGIRLMDVVKIQLEKFQVSIYLDANTHLPARIAYHDDEGGGKLKVNEVFEWYDLSDYRNVDGIMMPHKISHSHNPKRRLRYEVNPQYDPSVFTRKPDLLAGPEQWRTKS